MKAFKGFKPDLTCRGFQYAEGQTFEHDGDPEVCQSGFHAVLAPLDVLAYYPPASSIYHEVDLDEVAPKRDDDSKVAARKLTVGARINLVGLAQAHVEYVRENVDTSKKQTKVKGTASNTGDYSAASNTGYRSAASNTGYRSAASNTGDGSAASVKGEESVAIVTGRNSKAAGALGCWIVLTERDANWHIVEVRAVKIDGELVKAGVFYKLVGGELVEAGDQS